MMLAGCRAPTLLALSVFVNGLAITGLLFLLVVKNLKKEEPVEHTKDFISAGLISPTVENKFLMIVVILSKPSSLDCRHTIRQTWAQEHQGSSHNVLVRFSIGISGLPQNVKRDLAIEQQKFGDLMLLHNVKDSYSNLTLKILNSFIFASNHYNFSYFLKSDDDSFVILDIIVKELESRSSNHSYYWGYMFNRATVQTEGKYAEHDWFLSNSYLPYAKGIAYVLSTDLIRSIAGNPTKLKLYNNEDVSVGAWISPYKVERRHDKRFIANFKWCRGKGIVYNPVSASMMYSMYKHYIWNGTVC